MNIFKTMIRGSRYLELWPDHPILGAVFPEIRVRYFMRWGRRLIPPFIVFVVLWNFVQGGGLKGISFIYTQTSNWPLAVLSIIFLLGIFLHGCYWAGRRAGTALNARQLQFYKELCTRLERTPDPAPVMEDLVRLLREGLDKIGPDILSGI